MGITPNKKFQTPPNIESISHILSLDERLDFYLNLPREVEKVGLSGDIYQGRKLLYTENKCVFSYAKYKNSFWEWYSSKIIHLNPFRKIRSLPYFEQYRNLLTLSDFIKIFSGLPEEVKNAHYLLYHGEKELDDCIPFIRKARKIHDTHSVLFKLSTIRHLLPCSIAAKHDIDWRNKKSEVIWRGATTSARYRNAFVNKYYNLFDIGFSSTKQYPELATYRRKKLSIKEQLAYKYIVSLEGYDLASNLKWILSSNSVPVMPKPTWVSWIMEHKLIPYVHYLPLNNELDNLEELIAWANTHDDECRQIAQNGKIYMSQFFDNKKEMQIQEKLLAKYSELIQITPLHQ